jgi:hypothetical protein
MSVMRTAMRRECPRLAGIDEDALLASRIGPLKLRETIPDRRGLRAGAEVGGDEAEGGS